MSENKDSSFFGGLSKIFLGAVRAVSGTVGVISSGLALTSGNGSSAKSIFSESASLLGNGLKNAGWSGPVEMLKSFIPPGNSTITAPAPA